MVQKNQSEYRAGHLTLSRLPADKGASSERSDRLIIAGNVYGALPYLPQVFSAMASRGFEVWSFSFSGQDGTPGECSLETAVQDLDRVVSYVRNNDCERCARVLLLAHCASTIATTELFHRFGNPGIERLVFYGTLLNPARRRHKAEQRLARAGVKYHFTESDWRYEWLAKLSTLTVPTLFCHARDALNRDRATPDELDAAVRAAPCAERQWYEEGYDLRYKSIEQFANGYQRWFIDVPKQGLVSTKIKGLC